MISLKQSLVGLVLAVALARRGQAQIPQRSPELLRRADSLAALDPAREVQLALERRDHRFIGVCGYACFAPSPDGPVDVSDKELRVIEGTTDDVINQDVERLNEVADAYATKYNQLMLAALGRKATKRPPTSSPTAYWWTRPAQARRVASSRRADAMARSARL